MVAPRPTKIPSCAASATGGATIATSTAFQATRARLLVFSTTSAQMVTRGVGARTDGTRTGSMTRVCRVPWPRHRAPPRRCSRPSATARSGSLATRRPSPSRALSPFRVRTLSPGSQSLPRWHRLPHQRLPLGMPGLRPNPHHARPRRHHPRRRRRPRRHRPRHHRRRRLVLRGLLRLLLLCCLLLGLRLLSGGPITTFAPTA